MAGTAAAEVRARQEDGAATRNMVLMVAVVPRIARLGETRCAVSWRLEPAPVAAACRQCKGNAKAKATLKQGNASLKGSLCIELATAGGLLASLLEYFARPPAHRPPQTALRRTVRLALRHELLSVRCVAVRDPLSRPPAESPIVGVCVCNFEDCRLA